MPRKTRIAIITGGSRGLGRATVPSLAEQGVSSIFTCNSSCAEAEKVVTAAEQAGAKTVALQLDAGKVATFDGFVDSGRAALNKLGAERFDYLINNADISHHNAFLEV